MTLLVISYLIGSGVFEPEHHAYIHINDSEKEIFMNMNDWCFAY